MTVNEKVYDKEDLIHVLENIGEGIYLTDGNAKTLFINKAYENISGGNRGLFLDRNMKDIVEDNLIDDSASLKVLEKGKEVTMNQTLKNGRKVLITSSPIFAKYNSIKMVVTILRDVTRLKEMQEELALKEKRINNLMLVLERDGDIIYRSGIMEDVVNTALKAAEYNTTILINGETGVGKDLIAKLIYKFGLRKDKPFVDVNCAAIPTNLMESELFGYEPGSFTGASKKGKKGFFEMANGGTIFLDEIGELSLDMQTKLLKVIQDKKLYRVGGNEFINIDVNIISATNRNLYNMVKEGKFREDLFYRLNVIPIYIPPLRERKEDIPVLIDYFLNKLINSYNQEKFFDEDALEVLYNYSWHGNIRELKNVIERTYILSKNSHIKKSDLPENLNSEIVSDRFKEFRNLNLYESVEKFEKLLIEDVLSNSKNNKKAAEILNVDPSTLTRKRQKYGI